MKIHIEKPEWELGAWGLSYPTGEYSTFFSSMLVIRQRPIYQNLSSLKQHVLLNSLSAQQGVNTASSATASMRVYIYVSV